MEENPYTDFSCPSPYIDFGHLGLYINDWLYKLVMEVVYPSPYMDFGRLGPYIDFGHIGLVQTLALRTLSELRPL